MSLLVVVAHPDDEVLGTAGVIATAVRAARTVKVAIATDGDAWQGSETGERRRAESLAGLALLGVGDDDVQFLGYPDNGLSRLFRFGARRKLRRDLHGLAAGAQEIYTHVPFDGHPDHAALARLVVEAAPTGVAVRGTLMHPPGAGSCLELSASRWPAPAGEPHERFLPAAEVGPPPAPACAPDPATAGWGPLGPPHEVREVPSDMQAPDEAENLKWQAIACHPSQVELGPVSAGYLRAFVRRHEFFWRLEP
ncbi:MAG: PIG-L deacetylase family protein [Gaiellaceae bacterium]